MRDIYELKASWNSRPKVIVIGLGDFIFRDDGIGVHAVRRFQQLKPRPCLAVEVGTSISETIRMLESADRVLAFDSVEAGSRPGTVYALHVQDILRKERYSLLHDMRLIGILQTMPNPPLEVVIVGAEPQKIEWGTELSPALDFAADVMVSTAQKVISRWKCWNSGHDQVDLSSIVGDSRLEVRQFL